MAEDWENWENSQKAHEIKILQFIFQENFSWFDLARFHLKISRVMALEKTDVIAM